MLTLWNGFDRAFDDEVRRLSRRAKPAERSRFGGLSYPPVNVIETDAALLVSAEVPGFAPENVDVTVHEGVLTLEGRVEEENEQEQEGKVLFAERRNVSFKRTFTLNTDIDVDAITAVVKDGLLTVTLPKADAVKPRQIAVQSGD
jgi:HSP20 family protein